MLRLNVTLHGSVDRTLNPIEIDDEPLLLIPLRKLDPFLPQLPVILNHMREVILMHHERIRVQLDHEQHFLLDLISVLLLHGQFLQIVHFSTFSLQKGEEVLLGHFFGEFFVEVEICVFDNVFEEDDGFQSVAGIFVFEVVSNGLNCQFASILRFYMTKSLWSEI